jgi:hypothetical protein
MPSVLHPATPPRSPFLRRAPIQDQAAPARWIHDLLDFAAPMIHALITDSGVLYSGLQELISLLSIDILDFSCKMIDPGSNAMN